MAEIDEPNLTGIEEVLAQEPQKLDEPDLTGISNVLSKVKPLRKKSPNFFDSFQPTNSNWNLSGLSSIEDFFKTNFGNSLPLTNKGQSSIHNKWGLDHRNSADVDIDPSSAQGQRLISYLKENNIPYLAFTGPIPGVSTGKHIHIGMGSHKTLSKFGIGETLQQPNLYGEEEPNLAGIIDQLPKKDKVQVVAQVTGEPNTQGIEQVIDPSLAQDPMKVNFKRADNSKYSYEAIAARSWTQYNKPLIVGKNPYELGNPIIVPYHFIPSAQRTKPDLNTITDIWLNSWNPEYKKLNDIYRHYSGGLNIVDLGNPGNLVSIGGNNYKIQARPDRATQAEFEAFAHNYYEATRNGISGADAANEGIKGILATRALSKQQANNYIAEYNKKLDELKVKQEEHPYLRSMLNLMPVVSATQSLASGNGLLGNYLKDEDYQTFALKNLRLANNLKYLGEALYTGTRHGWESDQYTNLIERNRADEDVLSSSEESIYKPKTWGRSIKSALVQGGLAYPELHMLGPYKGALTTLAALENLHRGNREMFLAALPMAVTEGFFSGFGAATNAPTKTVTRDYVQAKDLPDFTEIGSSLGLKGNEKIYLDTLLPNTIKDINPEAIARDTISMDMGASSINPFKRVKGEDLKYDWKTGASLLREQMAKGTSISAEQMSPFERQLVLRGTNAFVMGGINALTQTRIGGTLIDPATNKFGLILDQTPTKNQILTDIIIGGLMPVGKSPEGVTYSKLEPPPPPPEPTTSLGNRGNVLEPARVSLPLQNPFNLKEAITSKNVLDEKGNVVDTIENKSYTREYTNRYPNVVEGEPKGVGNTYLPSYESPTNKYRETTTPIEPNLEKGFIATTTGASIHLPIDQAAMNYLDLEESLKTGSYKNKSDTIPQDIAKQMAIKKSMEILKSGIPEASLEWFRENRQSIKDTLKSNVEANKARLERDINQSKLEFERSGWTFDDITPKTIEDTPLTDEAKPTSGLDSGIKESDRKYSTEKANDILQNFFKISKQGTFQSTPIPYADVIVKKAADAAYLGAWFIEDFYHRGIKPTAEQVLNRLRNVLGDYGKYITDEAALDIYNRGMDYINTNEADPFFHPMKQAINEQLPNVIKGFEVPEKVIPAKEVRNKKTGELIRTEPEKRTAGYSKSASDQVREFIATYANELAWTAGLEDFLKEHEGKNINKKDLMEVIQNGQVRTEVSVAREDAEKVFESEKARLKNELEKYEDHSDPNFYSEEYFSKRKELGDQIQKLDQDFINRDRVRYSLKAYTREKLELPGAKDSEEVKLITPLIKDENLPKNWERLPLQDVEEDSNVGSIKSDKYAWTNKQTGNTIWTSDEINPPNSKLLSGDQYKSPHWNVMNVVAHYRSTLRTTLDNLVIKFSEEFQSDWNKDISKAYSHQLETIARRYDEIDTKEFAKLNNEEKEKFLLDFADKYNKFDIKDRIEGANRGTLKRVPTGATYEIFDYITGKVVSYAKSEIEARRYIGKFEEKRNRLQEYSKNTAIRIAKENVEALIDHGYLEESTAYNDTKHENVIQDIEHVADNLNFDINDNSQPELAKIIRKYPEMLKIRDELLHDPAYRVRLDYDPVNKRNKYSGAIEPNPFMANHWKELVFKRFLRDAVSAKNPNYDPNAKVVKSSFGPDYFIQHHGQQLEGTEGTGFARKGWKTKEEAQTVLEQKFGQWKHQGIGWTTSRQQMERYGSILEGKHFKWQKNSDGTYTFQLARNVDENINPYWDMEGHAAWESPHELSNISLERFAELTTPEAAQEVRDQEAKTLSEDSLPSDVQVSYNRFQEGWEVKQKDTNENLGLGKTKEKAIENYWTRNFDPNLHGQFSLKEAVELRKSGEDSMSDYDDVYVNYAKKIGKQFEAEYSKKLIDTPNTEVLGDSFNSEYLVKYLVKEALKEGKEVYGKVRGKDGWERLPQDTTLDHYTYDRFKIVEPKQSEIHYLEITPQMRESLLREGFPIYGLSRPIKLTNPEIGIRNTLTTKQGFDLHRDELVKALEAQRDSLVSDILNENNVVSSTNELHNEVFGSGLSPDAFVDFTKLSFGDLKDFATFTSELIKRFGEAIQPYLKDLWIQAKGLGNTATTALSNFHKDERGFLNLGKKFDKEVIDARNSFKEARKKIPYFEWYSLWRGVGLAQLSPEFGQIYDIMRGGQRVRNSFETGVLKHLEAANSIVKTNNSQAIADVIWIGNEAGETYTLPELLKGDPTTNRPALNAEEAKAYLHIREAINTALDIRKETRLFSLGERANRLNDQLNAATPNTPLHDSIQEKLLDIDKAVRGIEAHFQELKESGYISTQRQGNIAAFAEDPLYPIDDPRRKLYNHFDTPKEAEAWLQSMRDQFQATNLKYYDLKKPEQLKSATANLTPGQFEDLIDRAGVNAKSPEIEKLRDEVYSRFPTFGYELKRDFTRGYNRDWQFALESIAHQTENYASSFYSRVAGELALKQLDQIGLQQTNYDLYKVAQKYIDHEISGSEGADALGAVRKGVYLFQLGFDINQLYLNAVAQPITQTYSYFSRVEHNGITLKEAEPEQYFIKAGKLALELAKERITGKGNNVPKEFVDIYNRLKDEKVIEPEFNKALLESEAEKTVQSQAGQQGILKVPTRKRAAFLYEHWAGVFMRNGEKATRTHVAAEAYLVGKEKFNLEGEELVDFMVRAIDATQSNPSRAEIPLAVRANVIKEGSGLQTRLRLGTQNTGEVRKLLYQFNAFNHMWLENLALNVKADFYNTYGGIKSRAGAAEFGKNLVKDLGENKASSIVRHLYPLVVMGGIKGLPLSPLASALFTLITDKDPKEKFDEFFGNDTLMERMALYGVTGSAALSNRLTPSMPFVDNLKVGNTVRGTLSETFSASNIPAIATATQIVRGFSDLIEGNKLKAVGEAFPNKLVRNAANLIRVEKEGLRTRANRTLVTADEVTPLNKIGVGIGLQPNKVIENYDRQKVKNIKLIRRKLVRIAK